MGDKIVTVSMKDVALKAGVSIASVSRVISGKPGVGKETEKKIREVMDELDYRPNMGARGLVMKSTGNIAIVIPRGTFTLNNPFFSTVLEGIAKGLDKTDYNMVMSFTSLQQKRLLETQSVDGVILFAPRYKELKLEWLESIGLPIVVIGSYLEDSPFPCVRPNDEMGTKKAVEELYKLGHRNIGFINGPMDSMHSVKCLRGYKNTIESLNMEYTKNNVFEVGEFEIQARNQDLEKFLIENSRITGFVCSSDYLAIGLIKAAGKVGLKIPEDLSVVGLDDVPLSSHITPALSTVHVDLIGIGKRASAILINLLKGKQIRKKEIVFEMDFISRDTTGIVKD